MAVWRLRGSRQSKGWMYRERPGDAERSLGDVSSDIENEFLREWVVMRALPGDIILMDGRPWLMCPPIGLRIEQRREGAMVRDVVVGVEEKYPL